MKRTTHLLLSVVLGIIAQSHSGLAQAASGYTIVERGPDYRVLERTRWETNGAGHVVARTNRFTELATGMHVRRGADWVAASADIALTSEGAAATNRAHPVAFAPNLNRVGAVDLTLPDGRRLRSRIVGLSYYDSASGETVMLGRVRDTVGLLYPPNQVIYTNAFDGAVTADVQLVCSLAGFEQNLVLRSQPPAPADLGLRAETTWLQVITEFFDPPVPAREFTRDAAGNVTDETLNFSGLVMGSGKAFAVGYADEQPARVFKRWVTLDSGRTFLVEQVPLATVAASLQRLPAARQGAALPRSGAGRTMLAGLEAVLPEPVAAPPAAAGLMARVDAWSPRGFVLDYSLVSSATNFTFQGDMTYVVTNTVNLSGTTVIEGGTVVKFSTNATAQINTTGGISCQTGPYRPAIFTSRDDNTVGEIVPGSTGTPTNYFGSLRITSSGNQLAHARFSHLLTAVNLDLLSPGQLALANVQFVQCRYPLRASLFACMSTCESVIQVDNALVFGADVVFQGVSGFLRARHLTVNQCNTLGYDDTGDSGMYLTNSLLVAVMNLGNVYYTNRDHTVWYTTDPGGIFQTVGAGAHYLVNGSTNRNAGTTNLSAAMLATLPQTTTEPPVEITTNLTAAITLAPQAARDADVPDLGYHYDPLDFVVRGRTVSAALTLTNGVALGTYGGAASPGLRLDGGGSLVSEGSPARLNWIARYHVVQEQASTNWAADTVGTSVTLLASVPVNVRFTGWAVLGGTGGHFYDPTASATPSVFSHCRFGGGEFKCDPGSAALTNCLWERTYLTLNDGGDALQWYFCNNLFSGGRLWYEAHSEDTVTLVRDNLFDRTTIAKSPGTENLTHDHNGYVTNQNRLMPNGAGDVILTNTPAYLTGPLGRYYYPTDDGMLSRLLDAGSVADAAQAGLYHFTTTTNQVKETNSTVDIGFHYVSLNGDGETPADADGDGLPDYFEDRNANGIYDAGDLADWRDPDTDNDGVADSAEFFNVTTNFCSGVVTTNLSYTAATNPAVFAARQLATFAFNDANLVGERGQAPLLTNDLQAVGAWITKGVQLTNSTSQLIYRTVETNDATANLNLRSGSVRFWFKPQWASGTGNAPADGARLLEVGTPDGNGWWALFFAA